MAASSAATEPEAIPAPVARFDPNEKARGKKPAGGDSLETKRAPPAKESQRGSPADLRNRSNQHRKEQVAPRAVLARDVPGATYGQSPDLFETLKAAELLAKRLSASVKLSREAPAAKEQIRELWPRDRAQWSEERLEE